MEIHLAEAYLILDIQRHPAVNAPLPVLITVRLLRKRQLFLSEVSGRLRNLCSITNLLAHNVSSVSAMVSTPTRAQ